MYSTFDQSGDIFKNGLPKQFWSHGAVGKVSLHSNSDHPFTGIFKGADEGLIRLSTMVGTDPKPGMGLKFLRDGRDSANVVSAATSEESFFKTSMSNH